MILKAWIANLNIAKKLSLCFGLCFLLAALIANNGLQGMRAMNGHVNELNKGSIEGLLALTEYGQAVNEYRTKQFRLAGSKDPKRFSDNLQDVADSKDEANKFLAAYGKTVTVPEERKLFDDLSAGWLQYTEVGDKIEKDIVPLSVQEGSELVENRTTDLFEKIVVDPLNTLNHWKKAHANTLVSDAHAAVTHGSSVIWITLVIALLVGIAAARAITSSVTVPVAQIQDRLKSLQGHCISNLREGLEALATGDLTYSCTPATTPVPYAAKDELGNMAATFNDVLGQVQTAMGAYEVARENLQSLVGQVIQNAQVVDGTSQKLAAASQETSASASQIAAGSSRLADNAANAAASVRQLIQSAEGVRHGSVGQGDLVTEMAASVAESNAGVASVTKSAGVMENAAKEGNAAVLETVAAMGRVRSEVERSSDKVRELDQQGKEIGKIVGTIQEIAEQTNLLSLNAAIEAARAGEHGRGFAVVADEVRKLAEQTSLSTKQIAELIRTVTRTVDDTVQAIQSVRKEVETGSQKSEAAGASLTQILDATQMVLTQNQSVSNVAGALSKNIAEVSRTSNVNLNAATEMVASAQSVREDIEGVAAISSESSAAVEEMSAVIEEVDRAAKDLSETSRELTAVVASFRLDDAPQTKAVPRKAPLKRAA